MYPELFKKLNLDDFISTNQSYPHYWDYIIKLSPKIPQNWRQRKELEWQVQTPKRFKGFDVLCFVSPKRKTVSGIKWSCMTGQLKKSQILDLKNENYIIYNCPLK